MSSPPFTNVKPHPPHKGRAFLLTTFWRRFCLKTTCERQSWHKLVIGNWNITSPTGKEHELVEEAKQYFLRCCWHLFDKVSWLYHCGGVRWVETLLLQSWAHRVYAEWDWDAHKPPAEGCVHESIPLIKISSTLEWYSRVTERGIWYTDWWSKYSSAWAFSLCVHKTGGFKHRKAVSFEIRLCSDSQLLLWILGNDLKNTIPSANGRDGMIAKSSRRYSLRQVRNCEIPIPCLSSHFSSDSSRGIKLISAQGPDFWSCLKFVGLE